MDASEAAALFQESVSELTKSLPILLGTFLGVPLALLFVAVVFIYGTEFFSGLSAGSAASPGPSPSPGGDREEFVYVIQDIQTRLYKIGRTADMDRRMRELGVGKSAVLVSSKSVSDSAKVEREAHERYKAARLPQTEYFKLDSPPQI